MAGKVERQSFIDDLPIIYSSAKQLKAIVEHLASPSGALNTMSENGKARPVAPEVIQGTAGVIRSLENLSSPREAPWGCILVVDDNAASRDLLCSCLKREGHFMTTAENGRQALDLLASQDFDLVLLDIVMPEMNGYQVLEHMRGNASLQHIPVIMISAFDEAGSAARCIEIGAEEYLTKPFDRNLLKARVKACLKKKLLSERTVQKLNVSLDSKANKLEATTHELGASLRKIEQLEENTTRIQSAVRQEIEKTQRVSLLNILVILACGFILGFVFNAANPGGIRLLPQSWSSVGFPLIDLDSAKSKFDGEIGSFRGRQARRIFSAWPHSRGCQSAQCAVRFRLHDETGQDGPKKRDHRLWQGHQQAP